MDKEELGSLYPVNIVEHSKLWPLQFIEEEKELNVILGPDIALRIEHIGSTAVPGLSAKPTIDILIEIPVDSNMDSIIKRMKKHKYIHMEEQLKHLMFVKGYSSSGLEKKSFHIHMGPKGMSWLWDRIYFRDYLRKNKQEVLNYEEIKTELASQYKFDREAYTDSKAEYITRITGKAKNDLGA